MDCLVGFTFVYGNNYHVLQPFCHLFKRKKSWRLHNLHTLFIFRQSYASPGFRSCCIYLDRFRQANEMNALKIKVNLNGWLNETWTNLLRSTHQSILGFADNYKAFNCCVYIILQHSRIAAAIDECVMWCHCTWITRIISNRQKPDTLPWGIGGSNIYVDFI